MYEDWHQPQGERSREYGRGRVSCTPLTPRESFVAEAVGALIWTWHSPIPQRLLFWPLCCQAVKQTVVHVPDGVDCMPGQRGHSGKMPCLYLPFNIPRSLDCLLLGLKVEWVNCCFLLGLGDELLCRSLKVSGDVPCTLPNFL